MKAATVAPPKNAFVEHIRSSKAEIGIFIAFHLIFAFVFNYYYPHIDIFSDTGGYINWAAREIYGGTRPRGYSNFLKYLHDISTGSFIVFVSQYIIYCLSQLFLYLTSTYFLSINARYVRYLLLTMLSLSFAALYTTNMGVSDSVFTSCTTIMLTFCIWMVCRPNVAVYIGILVAMMAAVTIRYIGLVYPAIAFVAFLLSLKDKKMLLGATFLMGLLAWGYVQRVTDYTERDQGTRIFSAFGGWQQASNALHIVPHVDISKPLVESDDPDVLYADAMARGNYQALPHKYPDGTYVTYDFIWLDSLALKQGLAQYGGKKGKNLGNYFILWNKMGAIYKDYGDLMIKTYPLEFFKYYLWPNTVRTLHPPVEAFTKFQHTGPAGRVERAWFNIKDDRDIQPRGDFMRPILLSLSPLYTALWLLFFANVAMFIYIVLKRRDKISLPQRKAGLLLILFTFIYTGASIYGAPVNLRFLMPLKPAVAVLTALNLAVLYPYFKTREELTTKMPVA